MLLTMSTALMVAVQTVPLTGLPIRPRPVDLLLSYRLDADRPTKDQLLFGTFSSVGTASELSSADVVQMFPYRACDIKRKGFDMTLLGHIAVVFFDELEPFIAGCVSLDNQARFAQQSGALALIVGPAHRIILDDKQKSNRPVDIAVVTLDSIETLSLKRQLEAAAKAGSVVHMGLSSADPEPPRSSLTSELLRMTPFNVGLLLLLLLLLLFIAALICLKLKWRPRSHREVLLRCLARTLR